LTADGGGHHRQNSHAFRRFSRVDPRATKGIIIPPLFIPSILLLLKEEPTHGYALMKKLSQLGVVSPDMDPSPIYKTLRWFEEIGLAVSESERGERGPDRKVYRVTEAGDESLAFFASRVEEAGKIIAWFQRKYEELR
jgi:DNA-binding PadR family transcriptional regulator